MSRRTRRILLTALVTVCLMGGTACGDDKRVVVAPKPVPDGLVPAQLATNNLAFYDTQLESAKKAFAEAGPLSLAADGRLWELRTGDRLIGVLQVTTLMPDVDLREKSHRESIVKQLLPSVRDRIDLGDVPVWTATAAGKSTFLWFGDHLFALLTMKPGSADPIEPEQVLQEVVDHMVAAEQWKYVYFDDEDTEG